MITESDASMIPSMFRTPTRLSIFAMTCAPAGASERIVRTPSALAANDSA